MKVTAEDGERSTSKTIVLEVEDINDNGPEFEYPVSFVYQRRIVRYKTQVIILMWLNVRI